jgi:hypothetical protein
MRKILEGAGLPHAPRGTLRDVLTAGIRFGKSGSGRSVPNGRRLALAGRDTRIAVGVGKRLRGTLQRGRRAEATFAFRPTFPIRRRLRRV